MSGEGTITIVRCGGMAEHWKRVIERGERGREGQEGGAEVLKSEGGASVVALPGEKGAAGLVVKRWELGTAGARLKAALKVSRAWRHWKGAERLTAAGVRTAACYAIARSVKRGVAIEWLVMDRLPGKTLLRHMADGDLTVKQEHALAAAVGEMLERLIAHKRFNRDGKPSNLIVGWSGGGAPTVSVIDCVAIRGGATEGKLVPMLASLVIEPLGCGRGVLPRRGVLMRALRSYYASAERRPGLPADWVQSRDFMWGEVAEAVRKHGDPRPKVDPLK
ncbi:MAG TPA: hypothetical protein VFF65_07830 [Phycisphaerales bacterium]|nr:hypothetical protein [Phycisphaerales bacterium]